MSTRTNVQAEHRRRRKMSRQMSGVQTNAQTLHGRRVEVDRLSSGRVFTPQIFGFYPNFPFKYWAGAAAQFSREGFTIGAQQEVGGCGEGGERCGGWEQCVEILELSSCLLIWFGITLKFIPGKKCENKLLRTIRPKLS